MKRPFSIIWILVTILTLTSCLSYGGMTTQKYRNARLVPYRSKRADVIKKLGEPYSSSESQNGARLLTIDSYPSRSAAYRWIHYIPFVGYFLLAQEVSNVTGENFMLTLTYQNDVLISQQYVNIRN